MDFFMELGSQRMNLTSTIEDEGSPIENKFVLPADLVEIDKRQSGFTHAAPDQFQPHIFLAGLFIRRLRP